MILDRVGNKRQKPGQSFDWSRSAVLLALVAAGAVMNGSGAAYLIG